MITAIRAIADMVANFFGWRTSVSDNRATAEVIDDKRDLEKACRYAEKAIELVEEEAAFLKERVEDKFKKFVKLFRKYK